MHYTISPGVEVVPINGTEVLLRSDIVEFRLEGPSASTFDRLVFPLVSGNWVDEDTIMRALAEYDRQSVHDHLQDLAAAGVLLAAASPTTPGPARFLPVERALQQLGIPGSDGMQRLRSIRVAILGLEGIGGHAALTLARTGVGRLSVIDPYACVPENLALMPSTLGETAGRSRQECVRDALVQSNPEIDVAIHPHPDLHKDHIFAIAAEHDYVLSCFDRAFAAASHWINRAALHLGTPVLFGELQSTRALVGPMLLPGESACFMCWRMRFIATRESFDEAMAYEQHNDRQRLPVQDKRPCLPPLASAAGSIMSMELLRVALGIGIPRLGNRVIELDGVELVAREHSFLHVPECPACQGATTAVRKGDVQSDTRSL